MPDGISVLLVAGSSFLLSAALTDLVRRVCLRWGILDQPTGQRWHRAPRPRLGGVAIFAALVICVGVFAAHPLPRSAWGLLVGAAFVFAWGLVDDLRQLPPSVKLLLLAMTGGIPLAFGLSFQAPGPAWGMLLTGLWVMGMTNAINWLDNMDGVAAGVTTVAAATLFGLSIVSGNILGGTIALALGGAALGFLVLNFPPAKIFMGDCGSGVLGYSLAVTALLVARSNVLPFPGPILVSAFVLGVPILDMVLVAVLRTLRGQSIFVGGRDHLAHRLVAWGFSEPEVVALLYTLGLVTGAAAAFIMQASPTVWLVAAVLGTFPLVIVGVLGSLTRIENQLSRLWSSLKRMCARYGVTVLQSSLIIAGLALLYHTVVASLVYQWRGTEEYSHGPLVLLLSGYLVWRQRANLWRCISAPSLVGYAVILLGLALLIVGEAAVVGYLMRVSLIVVIAGLILYLSGPRMLQMVSFPMAYLLFMIPLPYIVFDRITLPLQFLASNVAASALDAIGIPVLREGNVINLATTTLGVTEACSGIRSLISLIAIGTIYAYLFSSGLWRRAALVASTVPIAIVTNALRVAITGILASLYGIQAALGFYHTFSGLLIFVLATCLLVLEGGVLAAMVPSAGWRGANAQGI